jgi:GT2 family glycosyltransferase
MKDSTIAVLITCFNRKKHTVKCIERLFSVFNSIDVYLVDDGSVDGTSQEIQNKFPQVKLIKGSGDLYWNRGMHLAWEHARKKDYEFYLWINDDVTIYDNCFLELMECSKKSNYNSIITGVIESPDKKKIIYGGKDKQRNRLYKEGDMKEVHYMNGNVVLVSRKIFKLLGNLDSRFHHDYGDVDYGFRALKNNIKIYTTTQIVGSCLENNNWRVRKLGTSIINRFRLLYSPIGANPNNTFYFKNKHFGFLNALIYYVYLHFINTLSDTVFILLFKNRYQDNS